MTDAIAEAWNSSNADIKCEFRESFAVEVDEAKRRMLLARKYQHVFGSAEEFASGRAFCHKTKQVVDTYALTADIILAGCMRSEEPSTGKLA